MKKSSRSSVMQTNMIPKARSIKEKIGKLNFIKIKICSLKDTVKEMKKPDIVLEKSFTNQISDKEHVLYYIKNSQNSRRNNLKNLGKKCGQALQ